jgi:hypothetical protein
VNPYYLRVAERAGHRCEYCHAPEAIFNLPFEVEHVLPVSRGGADGEDNMALACRPCNLFKSDRTTAGDPATGAEAPLFHPRRDVWAEHFRVEVETAAIVGLTPAGRATVAGLRMNSPVQLVARRAWTRLGLFP